MKYKELTWVVVSESGDGGLSVGTVGQVITDYGNHCYVKSKYGGAYHSYTKLRLATTDEIIKAGGVPQEENFNYSIF